METPCEKASCEINEEALKRSTLRYLNPAHSTRIPHDAVLHIDNPYQVTRANVKIRLATMKSRMKLIKDDTCTLCNNGDQEDQEHFLIKCSRLILDPSHPALQGAPMEPKYRPNIEAVTRDYIFALHLKRTALVKMA